MRQQHGELVAAQPGDRVRLPGRGGQAAAELDQGGVARGMAEAVVDELQAVHVQQQHGDRRVAALDLGGRMPQPVHEEGAVGQAGHVVMGGAVEEVVAAVAGGPVHRGAQHLGHQREHLHLAIAEVAGTGGEGLEHADRRALVRQRQHDHRAQPDAAAGLEVDAAVGLDVLADQRDALAQAGAGKAAVAAHPHAQLMGGGAGDGAVDQVLAFGQLDRGAVGIDELQRAVDRQRHHAGQVQSQLGDLAVDLDDAEKRFPARHRSPRRGPLPGPAGGRARTVVRRCAASPCRRGASLDLAPPRFIPCFR